MERSRLVRFRREGLALVLAAALVAPAAEAHPPAAPEAGLELPPAPGALEKLLAADRDSQRGVDRLIEHGRWEELHDAELTAPQQASLLRRAGVRPDTWPAALAADPGEAVALERAQAWMLYGRFGEALDALPPSATLARARCLFEMGRYTDAAEVLGPVLGGPPAGGADGLRERAEGLLLGERLGVAGPDASRRASALLDEATELAPLDARPREVHAALLFARDNRPEGGAALEAALARNPLDARSLHLLGEAALDAFDFGRADAVIDRLNHLSRSLPEALRPAARAAPGHPFAARLAAGARLRLHDVDGALAVIEAAGPGRSDLLPVRAAVEAVSDPAGPAAAAAMQACEEAAPGGAAAYAAVGSALAAARLYPEAIAHLNEAIRRLPGDAGPHHALGRTLAQAGDLPGAVRALDQAVRLDPFHADAANSLALFERMLTWPVVETEHFRIRHAPGVDAVLAADMAREMEGVRTSVDSFFDHTPARPTQIDLLPDAPSFAVRITGRPEIWTIAACTGDVIAMTPPRLGPDQAGNYHWRNVLRHEYAHTVTLDQTGNRIAHWLTEAAAVNAESVGRAYGQARLLADALAADALFPYEELNLGFIRPQKPTDRPLAYAQSAWMLEHILEVDGRANMLAMLDAAADGASDAGALLAATGLTPDAFFARFRPWAEAAVARWGLAAGPPPEAAAAFIAAVKAAADPAAGAAARAAFAALAPGEAHHPDALEAAARLETRWGSPAAAIAAVERYALARPVDPWSQTALADAALAAGDADAAAAHLAVLERADGMTARSARLLMELFSRTDRPADALAAAEAALLRQPYSAELREQAAALAIRAGDWAEAEYQVVQLTRLEPDEPQHTRRLEALRLRRGVAG